MIYTHIPTPAGVANTAFGVSLVSDQHDWAVVDPTKAEPVDGGLYLVEGGCRPAALARCREGRMIPAPKEGTPGGRMIFGGRRHATGRIISKGGTKGL